MEVSEELKRKSLHDKLNELKAYAEVRKHEIEANREIFKETYKKLRVVFKIGLTKNNEIKTKKMEEVPTIVLEDSDSSSSSIEIVN